eukprot:TRINITY_DN16301_c0_g1_i1.p1 TRINITY_DN16301_c0_g1~~TRINITY_DN16301_c0_g1_i1.p1  ORF type:complete len:475 (+),score=105.52 TRINITY_DN16301_c0_g1_i1:100-1425(+)
MEVDGELLPTDVLENIMSFAAAGDVAQYARVSVQWYNACNADRLWRGITLDRLAFAGSDKTDENWKQYYIRTVLTKESWEKGRPRLFKMQAFRGHTKHITGICNLGESVGSASADGTMRFWRADGSGEEAGMIDVKKPINAFQHTVDTLYVAAGKTCHQFDLTTGALKSKIVAPDEIETMSLDDDSDQLLVTGQGYGVVYDVRSGQKAFVLDGLKHQSVWYGKCQFDKRYSVVTAGNDSCLVFDMRKVSPAHEYRPFSDCITSCLWCPESDDVVIGNYKGKVVSMDCRTGKDTHVGSVDGRVTCLERTKSHVVAGSSKGDILVVNYYGKDDTTIHASHPLSVHAKRVNALHIHGTRLTTASADGSAQVFSLSRTATKMFSVLGGSLQPNPRNPPHPEKPFISYITSDDTKLLMAWNSVLRVYDFTLKAQKVAEDCGEVLSE